MGTDASRPRPPEGGGGHRAPGASGIHLRHEHGPGGGTRGTRPPLLPGGRAAPLRHNRHRGDDERASRGPRRHEALRLRETGRLLPWPRRCISHEGWLRARHARDPRFARRAGVGGTGRANRHLQRPRLRRRGFREGTRGDRGRDRGAGGRQLRMSSPVARFSPRPANPLRPPRRGAHLRRGDVRLPRLARGSR